MRKRFLVYLLCVASSLLAKETIVVGDVVNETTGDAIANVDIYYRSTHIGTTSDENGAFALRVDIDRKRTLVFSAIGYQPQHYTIEPGSMAGIQVALKEKIPLLGEVVVMPNANEALPLIEGVRASRPLNDWTLQSNRQNEVLTHTQLYVSDISKRQLQRRWWQNLRTGMIAKEDSTYLLPLYWERQSWLLRGKEMIPANDQQREALILSKDDYSILLTTQGNLNFYQPTISLLGNAFLSPLAQSGDVYYNYYLVDSIASDTSKTYVIDFRTRNPFYATFNGSLHIDSASLAIRYVCADVPAQTSVNYLNNLHIEQYYALDHSLEREHIGFLLDFAIKTDTTHIFPTLLYKHTLVSKRPAHTRWTCDSVALDSTLAALDSLQQKPMFRVAKWFATSFIMGYIPTGSCVDIGHIQEIISTNPSEQVHIGLPLRTNEKLWKNVSLEAAIGYGWRDKKLKGLGKINVQIPSKRRNILTFEYIDRYARSEVDEFSRLYRENGTGLRTMDFTNYFFHSIHSNQNTVNSFAHLRQFSIETENDWSEHVETHLYSHFGWLPNYSFQTVGGVVRIGWNERKVDRYFHRTHLYSQYPVLYVGLEGGSWNRVHQSNYSMYAKLQLMLRQHCSLGMGGTLDWALEAGHIFGQVPYTMLHLFEGNQGYCYDPYRFTLMNELQYGGNDYIALHTEWNGKGILFNLIPGIRYLRLRELVSFHLAYGYINTSNQQLIKEMAPYIVEETQVPHIEIGVGLGNILRVADLYSVWRLTNRDDPRTPLWALRFRLHLDL